MKDDSFNYYMICDETFHEVYYLLKELREMEFDTSVGNYTYEIPEKVSQAEYIQGILNKDDILINRFFQKRTIISGSFWGYSLTETEFNEIKTIVDSYCQANNLPVY